MPNAIDIVANQEPNPLLEQLAGKGKGRVFELSIEEIRLGRDEDNDIVIGDESVSRHHATIERQADGTFTITDNQSKNGVILNKNSVISSPLSHGDIIQMGHFVFRFRIPGASSPKIQVTAPELKAPLMPATKGSSSPDKKRLYLYGGLIAFIGVMWAMSNKSSDVSSDSASDKAKKAEEFKPADAPEAPNGSRNAEVGALEDPLTQIDKEISNLENKDNSVKESEIYFKKGQRDYFNKNYHHAIDNFDTSISLWNRHPLANYYRGLAIHESEVQAKSNFEIGLKYFNSLQYSRAIYHFKAAIDYLSHSSKEGPAKKMIEQSERYIDFSHRKLKAMEIVP